MTPIPRLLSASVLLLAVVATAAGQDFSTTPVFTFAAAPPPGTIYPETVSAERINSDLKATEDLKLLRPNHSAEFYLYAYNPSKVKKTYTVELRAPGTPLAAQAKVTIPGEMWARVRLPKPAPPAPVPGAAPVVAAAPAPGTPPVVPPPPPGAELAPEKGVFQFTLRLLDADLAPVTDSTGAPYGRVVTAKLLRPDDYIAPPKGEFDLSDRLTRVTVDVEPIVDGNGLPAFTGTADLRLSFPPQSALSGAIIREGFYRRTLVVEPGVIPQGKTPRARLVGAVENAGDKIRIDVGVDGVERAFIYEPAPAAETKRGQLLRNRTQAIRVFPAIGYKTVVATQPVSAFPVRVEVDNPPREATVEIRVRPRASRDEEAVNETLRLGGAYEEKLWLDVSGPTEGLFVTTRAKDWVKPLDLAALRGDMIVEAVLLDGMKVVKSSPLSLIVDASAPEDIKFARMPTRHVKGRPLPVRASVVDPETKVVKAVFFVGKPLDDGKLPADAILTEGKMVDGNPGLWEAALPIPPEKRGEAIIGVVFTNEVGLATTATQRIELIDAPPPLGAIDGIVKAGELPAAGTIVNLYDADNKLKNTAIANSRGQFKMELIVPGTYILKASKPTSSYPLVASQPVQVEPDKRSKAALSMVKNVKGAPQ